MTQDLQGKVLLVTGATEGIGKAACDRFAERGATLVVTARNREKGERIVDEWKKASGNGRIELLVGDLSKQADVRAIARAFRDKHDKLDVLCNNAGALFSKYRESADGFEMTFALNHLSYFLLTHELLPVLKKTRGARIVSTSSDAHQRGKIDLETIAHRPSRKAGFAVYSDSKLANILFTRELARRLSGSGVTANCFHPGFVRTGFGHNDSALFALGVTIAGLFARTPAKGAETLIWLAASPDAERFSGEYFLDCAVAPTAARARDDGLAQRLWALSEKSCGLS
jgi:NAD(P)-dependent dehydrogenase (short-subunit alcohol dehydrogenase family)